MTEGDREDLLHRLTRQRSLLAQLESMGDEQDRLVREEQTEGLLALLAERQGIVDQIVELGRELDQQLGDVVTHPDEAVQALRDQIQASVGRIATRDEANRAHLDHRRRELSTELNGVGRGRSAMAAYSARPRQPVPQFKDTEA